MNKRTLIGPSMAAMLIAAPGLALAANECGPVNTASNPQSVTCTGAFAPYASGITYDDNTLATKGNLLVQLSGTALVNTTTAAQAVEANGADAAGNTFFGEVKALAGSNVTGSFDGLRADGYQGGNAIVDAFGTVQAGRTGLWAYADPGGTGTVTNESGGVVTVSGSTNNLAGILAYGGSTSISNIGQLTVNSSSGTRRAFGIETRGFAAGGTMQLVNSGTLTVTSGSGAAAGFVVDASSLGSATLSNTGTLSVTAGSGPATGMLVNTGLTGSSTLSSTAGFTVTSTSGAATAMDVESGSSTSMSSSQASAGSGGFTVSGASANGFVVNNVSGAVGIATTGGPLSVTSTAGAAFGANINGGTDVTASFADNKVGATVYGGDLTVKATGGAATGVTVAGATGAVTIGLSGAALGVTSTSGAATGISVNAGTNVSVTTAVDAATGNGAALTVSANGSGALGVGVTGATGTVGVALGDSLSVTSTSADANGVSVSGGTNDTIGLSKGATITGAAGASLGAGILGNSGTGQITVGGALSVTNTAGTAVGASFVGGTDGTVQFATGATLNVNAGGGIAQGVVMTGSGALSTTLGDTVTVKNTGGEADGVEQYNSTTQSVTLAKGITVQSAGGLAYGIFQSTASGAVTDQVAGTVSATATGGSNAFGIYDSRAASYTLTGSAVINATGAAGTTGMFVQNVSGPIAATVGNVTVVASTTGPAGTGPAGIWLQGTGSVNLTDAGTVDLTGNFGTGVLVSAAGAANVALNAVAVRGATAGGSQIGVSLSNSSAAAATVLGVQSVTADSAFGVQVLTTAASTTTLGSVSGSAHSGGVSTTGNASGFGPAAVTIISNGGAAGLTNNGLISTVGTFDTGVFMQGNNGAALTLSNWQISTTKNNSAGAILSTTGAGTVTSNAVSTTGASSAGLSVTTFGAATIASTTLSTTGAGSAGILVNSGAGKATVTSSTLATTGSASNGIDVATSTGAAAVSATNTSVTGAGSDAIHIASTSGAVTVSLADGGSTTSTSGAGVFVNTGGTATINAGVSAGTAQVSGGTWGILSTATGGTTVNISAAVTGAGGAAISLKGGASTINNLSNTIIGFVNLTTGNDVLNNSGTWNASATSDFGAGSDTVNNSGLINAGLGISTPVTVTFANLEVFNNTGTINLQQGSSATPHTGDVLDLGASTYVGSGAAKLQIDANLGSATVNGSAAQTADLLKAGAVSGATTLVINDLGAGSAGQLNLAGIPIVQASSMTAGAFTLQGGVIEKGFTEYRLAQNGTTLDLVGIPNSSSFELVRAGSEAQRFWRRSGDAWAEQMREGSIPDGHGVRAWAQVSGGSQTQQSRPTYSVTAAGNTFTSSPNLDIRDNYVGGQVGLDIGMGESGVGVTSGYGSQDGDIKASGDKLKVDGYNLGAYARFHSGALFAHVLAKYDGYSVKYGFQTAATNVSFNGTTWGIEAQAGYRMTSGTAFFEPVVGIAWTSSNLDGFSGVNSMAGHYGKTDSAYGQIGLRAGWSAPYGQWTVRPFAGAYYEGEMSGKNRLDMTSGGSTLSFDDEAASAHGRVEAGLTGVGPSGLTLFGKLDGDFGGVSGVMARAGVLWRW